MLTVRKKSVIFLLFLCKLIFIFSFYVILTDDLPGLIIKFLSHKELNVCCCFHIHCHQLCSRNQPKEIARNIVCNLLDRKKSKRKPCKWSFPAISALVKLFTDSHRYILDPCDATWTSSGTSPKWTHKHQTKQFAFLVRLTSWQFSKMNQYTE